MYRYVRNNVKNSLFIFAALLLSFGVGIFAVSLLSGTFTVRAGAGDNVSGFAWSDTIGWISFNNLSDGSATPYGVNINGSTGDFSGYAWSENIGWIDFAPTSGYPEAPNQGARLESDNTVTGWARALSYGGGWDGWIKLSGSWANGVRLSGSQFEGYAWGSDVMGWIDFSPAFAGGVTFGISSQSPIANDDTAFTSNDTPVNINVLGNDTDPNNDTLSIASVTSPANGTTQIISNIVKYTPNVGFSGVDTFNYTADDGNGGQDSATVSVTVYLCGNNIIESGEQCDGTDLGGATCVSEGFLGGALGCTSSCTFDTGACEAFVCGNDICETGETPTSCPADCDFGFEEF
ncbi:MAG: hypothetical protein BMS9Abin13_312 [Patescibacteria group bacterium]|nr:MAG: hypothetical protein BMS9Abin13_312 [Patescibacteria group bacterium]